MRVSTSTVFVCICICLCLSALTSTSQARPTFKYWHQDVQPRVQRIHPLYSTVQHKTLSHSMSFVSPQHPNQIMHLKYNIEHSDNIIMLDQEMEIDHIECNTEFTYIKLLTNHSTSFSNDLIQHLSTLNTLVSGSPAWGCISMQQTPTAILAKVVAIISISPTIIELQTQAASHADFFKNADIKLSSSYFPQGHFKQVNHVNQKTLTATSTHSTHSTHQLKSQLGWSFGDVMSYVWNGVQTISSQVSAAVNTVSEIVKDLTTGSISFDQQETLSTVSYNYDANKQAAASVIPLVNSDGLTISCDNCYAVLDMSVDIGVQVQNFQVQNISIVAEAQANLNIGASFNFDSANTYSNDILIATISGEPITFVIGAVPFVVQLSVPITAGYFASYSVTAKATANIVGSGNIRHGYEYSDGKFVPISSESISYSGGITSVSGAMTASATAYIMPTLVVSIDKIGGPNVAVKPTLEISLDSTSQLCPSGSMLLSSNVGVQVSVAANINITIAGTTIFAKSFGPANVFSYKKPLITGCLSLSSLGSSSESLSASPMLGDISPVTTSVAPGSTYIGNVTVKDDDACFYNAGYFSPIAFQMISTDGYSSTWIGSMNAMASGTSMPCIVQMTYDTPLDNIQFVASMQSLSTYQQCADGNEAAAIVWDGQFVNGFSQLSISNSDGSFTSGCLSAMLTLVS